LVTDIALPPPPVQAHPGGGGGRAWVELLRAHNDIDAHLLLGRLTEAGIETRAVKDRRAPGAWLYGGSNPWAPSVVLVRQLQLDEARLILASISLEAPDAAPGELTLAPGTALRTCISVALGLALSAPTLAQVARLLSGE
jgi:Putative prokaryotic signal transducing protein